MATFGHEVIVWEPLHTHRHPLPHQRHPHVHIHPPHTHIINQPAAIHPHNYNSTRANNVYNINHYHVRNQSTD